MSDEAAWDDPERAVQIEDSNPEALAGVEIQFDPYADDDDEKLEVFDLEGGA